MSYVDDNLLPGEQVVYRATLHWSIFSLPMAWSVVGLLICLLGIADGNPWVIGLGVFSLLAAILTLPKPLITYMTTEMVITNRQVIAKRGWIRRDILTLDSGRISSLKVEQGILDRIFNRGTVTAANVGGRRSAFPGIAKPLEFRRNALQTLQDRGKR